MPFTWKGKAWRGGDDPVYERGMTVADVARYEQDELGNDIGVTPETLKSLEVIPASRAIWVMKTKAGARRYGLPYRVDFVAPAVAVGGGNNDIGYLVVQGALLVELGGRLHVHALELK